MSNNQNTRENIYENDHVHKFYSKHASDFNVTRVKTWPKIASFLENDQPGFVNLDCGCGNGRNLKRGFESIWIGLDYSRELLECIINKEESKNNEVSKINEVCTLDQNIKNNEVSKNNGDSKNNEASTLDQNFKNNEVSKNNESRTLDQNIKNHKSQSSLNLIRGDCLSLPYKDSSFNLILSIAVIHHFSTPERRSQSLRELHRILKKDGKLLLYVWNEETKRKSKFKQIQDKDYLVKFNGVFDRYYYLYDLEEIESVCKENGFIIEESGIEQESIYLILSI